MKPKEEGGRLILQYSSMKAISFHCILKSVIYKGNQFRSGVRKMGDMGRKRGKSFKFISFIHSLKRKFISVFPQVTERENGSTPALSTDFHHSLDKTRKRI